MVQVNRRYTGTAIDLYIFIFVPFDGSNGPVDVNAVRKDEDRSET